MWKAGGAIAKGGGLAPEVSSYLLIPPPILRDACRALHHDDEGRGCASCCVRQFCDSQARRADTIADEGSC